MPHEYKPLPQMSAAFKCHKCWKFESMQEGRQVTYQTISCLLRIQPIHFLAYIKNTMNNERRVSADGMGCNRERIVAEDALARIASLLGAV